MGDTAEMMLEGILDEYTGEYIGPAVGYPRSRDPEHYSNQWRTSNKNHPAYNKNPYGGIQKWVMMNTSIRKPGKVWKAIRTYGALCDMTKPTTEKMVLQSICQNVYKMDIGIHSLNG